MKFARIVFCAAGIWGVLILTPLFFIFSSIGRNDPPPITHPGFYYGFATVGLAFQFVFIVIATDPVRFRPVMIELRCGHDHTLLPAENPCRRSGDCRSGFFVRTDVCRGIPQDWSREPEPSLSIKSGRASSCSPHFAGSRTVFSKSANCCAVDSLPSKNRTAIINHHKHVNAAVVIKITYRSSRSRNRHPANS